MTARYVLVADPPWQHGDKLGKRGAAKHYACMPLKEICALQLPVPARDCVLFLWRVASMQEEALAVVRAWGFTPKSELVWCKQTKTGLPHFGMGRYTRHCHEVCLIAVSNLGCTPAVHDQRSVIHAPVGMHSEKPDEFYRVVQRMYPRAQRHEMFARKVRRGWRQLGLELGKVA